MSNKERLIEELENELSRIDIPPNPFRDLWVCLPMYEINIDIGIVDGELISKNLMKYEEDEYKKIQELL